MKKTVLFSALALTTSVLADGDMIAGQMKSGAQSQKNQQNMMSMNGASGLAPSSPTSENGWYLFGDAIYWHASGWNTDWAEKLLDTAVSTGSAVNYRNEHLEFGWDWGFRVGVGVNMDYDHWDSNLSYTWLRPKESKSTTVTTGQAGFGNNLAVDDGFSKASYEHRIAFNMIDWELGRAHHLSKHLMARPRVGIKGGWINQKAHFDATYPTSSATLALQSEKLEVKNDFWGIGTSTGVTSNWILGNVDSHRFSLVSDVGGALMYGNFNHTQSLTTVNTSTTVPTGGYSFSGLDQKNRMVTMLQGELALMWDTEFNDDRCHFGLKVGYDFQYWFRQNQMSASLAASSLSQPSSTKSPSFFRIADDLALQGLTIDIRFDF